jgi:phosphoribosylformylglycinamidine synthase
MSATPLHLMHFEGGDALSAFRAQALLARCRRLPAHHGVAARHRALGGLRRAAAARASTSWRRC